MKPGRRVLGCVLAALVAATPLLAQEHTPATDKPKADKAGPRDAGELGPEAAACLDNALRWLADHQPDGGGGAVRGDRNEQEEVASTALAGLAWLASGSSETRGPYARNISNAAAFILSQKKPGAGGRGARFHGGADRHQGRMHAHGFALLFLAELYGMSKGGREERSRTLREALKEGVKLSIASQTRPRGGWGYDFAGESTGFQHDEASTTITQIQALRSARNAGIEVPAEVIERAIAYVKKSMTKSGAARYSLSGSGKDAERTSFELTAAAVATLNASGVYRSDELDRGLDFMRRQMAKQKESRLAASENYYFYGNLYAAQAMFQTGGADWTAWFHDAQQDLVARSRPASGGRVFWEDPRAFGDAYATASACLILAIPLRYLPIFER